MSNPRNRQIYSFILSASVVLLALLPARLAATTLTLAWDPNIEGDLAGYIIYYGTRSADYDSNIDVGNVTQHTVRGLEAETRYYFALRAYDFYGNESDFSAEVSAITSDKPAASPTLVIGGGSGGGGGCFIATAAYGSYLNPHVNTLRDFRDEFLISSSLGGKCVRLYYHYAPVVADYMEKYRSLRFLSRQALLPLIVMSSLTLKAATSSKFLFLPLSLGLILAIALPSYARQSR